MDHACYFRKYRKGSEEKLKWRGRTGYQLMLDKEAKGRGGSD
jgi:hypothetical protein